MKYSLDKDSVRHRILVNFSRDIAKRRSQIMISYSEDAEMLEILEELNKIEMLVARALGREIDAIEQSIQDNSVDGGDKIGT